MVTFCMCNNQTAAGSVKNVQFIHISRLLNIVSLCLQLTSVDDLSAHSQHDLTVTGGVGHQIQHLLVRTTFNHHAVDADKLVPSSQATILLCSSVGHNGPNVHLGKDILIQG